MFRHKQQQQQQQHKQWSARSEQQVHTVAGCDWGNRSVEVSSINRGLRKNKVWLLNVIWIGKDIRPTYAGSKSSAERLKRGDYVLKLIILTPNSNVFLFIAFLDIAYCVMFCRYCARKDSGAWGAHGGGEVGTAVDVIQKKEKEK